MNADVLVEPFNLPRLLPLDFPLLETLEDSSCGTDGCSLTIALSNDLTALTILIFFRGKVKMFCKSFLVTSSFIIPVIT